MLNAQADSALTRLAENVLSIQIAGLRELNAIQANAQTRPTANAVSVLSAQAAAAHQESASRNYISEKKSTGYF